MEAEVSKEPVKNFKSAISFWSKQDDNEPALSPTTQKPVIPKPRDARSSSPPPVPTKPKRNEAPLRGARSPSSPPPVSPKPKKSKESVAVSASATLNPKESSSDTPWKKDPHKLLEKHGAEERTPDIVERIARNLQIITGTIKNSQDTTEMSMEFPGEDGTLKYPTRTDAVSEDSREAAAIRNDLPKTERHLRDSARIDGNLELISGTIRNSPDESEMSQEFKGEDGTLKDPTRTDAVSKDSREEDDICNDLPKTDRHLRDSARIDGNLEIITGTIRNSPDKAEMPKEFKGEDGTLKHSTRTDVVSKDLREADDICNNLPKTDRHLRDSARINGNLELISGTIRNSPDESEMPKEFKGEDGTLLDPTRTDAVSEDSREAADIRNNPPETERAITGGNLELISGTIRNSPDESEMPKEFNGEDGTFKDPTRTDAVSEDPRADIRNNPPKTDRAITDSARMDRNLQIIRGTIKNSQDATEMSMKFPGKDGTITDPKDHDGASKEPLGTNLCPKNLLSKDKTEKDQLKTNAFSEDSRKTDLPETDKPPKDSPRTGGILKNSPRKGEFSKDQSRTSGSSKSLDSTDEYSEDCTKSFKDGSLSAGKFPAKGSVDSEADAESLGTIDLSMDEPNPDVDLSPNIKDYEEKLKESFRKARLKKASPKLKRKDIHGTAGTKQSHPVHNVLYDPSTLLDMKKSWESCLKDDTPRREYGTKYLERDSARQLIASKKPEVAEKLRRENSMALDFKRENLTEQNLKRENLNERDFKRENLSERDFKRENAMERNFRQENLTERNFKREKFTELDMERESFTKLDNVKQENLTKQDLKQENVTERVSKWEKLTERDAGSISTRISFFDSKTRNFTEKFGIKETPRSRDNQLEYVSTVSGQTFFKGSKGGANTECSSGGFQSPSLSCKERSRKFETQASNSSLVQPEKRTSTFQPIPIRFSQAADSQPKRWNFVDALSVSEDVSTSSSTGSSDLQYTSSSDLTSLLDGMGEQGIGEEDQSSASRSASDTWSTEDTDEEVTEGAVALEGAARREGARSTVSPARKVPMTSQCSRHRSQQYKSHRKSPQAPNGGHRQLKRSRSLENLYKLYHHLVAGAENRPVVQGDDVEGVNALRQSAGDNVLDEPEVTASESEFENLQHACVPRPTPRRFCIRRNMIMELFVALCCALGAYSLFIAYLLGIATKNDFPF